MKKLVKISAFIEKEIRKGEYHFRKCPCTIKRQFEPICNSHMIVVNNRLAFTTVFNAIQYMAERGWL